MRLKPNSLFVVDIDGILCTGEFWGKGFPDPIQENIDKINKLYRQLHHIILYTARREWWRGDTEAWLLKHKVLYHALVMGKVGGDYYIDDKFINIKDI